MSTLYFFAIHQGRAEAMRLVLNDQQERDFLKNDRRRNAIIDKVMSIIKMRWNLAPTDVVRLAMPQSNSQLDKFVTEVTQKGPLPEENEVNLADIIISV